MTDAVSGREPEQPEQATPSEAAAEQHDAQKTSATDAVAHPEPRAAEPRAAEPRAAEPATVEEPATAEQPAAAERPAETAAPAAPETPAPAAEQPAPPKPAAAAAQPTGTLYTPGQAPQPYHAAAYAHQQAAQQPAPPQSAFAHASAGQTGTTPPTSGFGQVPPVPPAFGGNATQPTEPIPPAGEADGRAKPKSRLGVGIAAGLVVGALIGGGSAAGVTALISANTQSPAPASIESPRNIVVNDTRNVNAITGVAAKAGPSVVTISVAGNEGSGTGSGVILSEDGYVLTNTHVVTLDGATGDPTIQVKDADGKLYTAELVGTDPMSDLAVIKLDATGLQPIEFADSSKLNVGDAAIAIGAPLDLANTVTNGIVSALNRSISVASSAAPEQSEEQSDEGQQGGPSPFDFWNYPGQENEAPQQQAGQGQISIPVIQTDAAINPGNSGGALLDADGKLIGINVAILGAGGGSESQAGNIGLGFAVPSNLAERVAKELIEDGTASHGLLGATVGSAAAAEGATTTGALVNEVTQGGAAAEAGLQAGDVVTSFNGLPITDQTDLTAQVRALPGGAKAEIGFVRDGDTHTVEVTLGELES